MKSMLLIMFFTFSVQAEVPIISVTGSAVRAVDPNMVNLQVDIWSRSPKAKSAQEAVAKEYARIKSSLERHKIKKEDIETTAYNLTPEMDYSAKGGARPIGYRVSHILQVTHRKIDEVGALVDILSSASKIESGGVNIQNMSWDYDKREEVQLSLIAEAVKDAKKKADELAKASNVKIKGPHRISTYNQDSPIIDPRKMRSEAMLASSADTEMSTGTIKIRVQVQADYSIQQ